MKDQSHKDEMSAALRRDFERLRERGVSTTLTPPMGSEPAPEPAATDVVPEQVREEIDLDIQVESGPDGVEPGRRGRFARLFGR